MKKINILVREETDKGYEGNIIIVFLDNYNSRGGFYDVFCGKDGHSTCSKRWVLKNTKPVKDSIVLQKTIESYFEESELDKVVFRKRFSRP